MDIIITEDQETTEPLTMEISMKDHPGTRQAQSPSMNGLERYVLGS